MRPKKTIVCFGAGPAFKGGMANYNTSLAKALNQCENTEVHMVSWSHQYPSIIPREFKDSVSTLDFLRDTGIDCKYLTNYNNPFSWNKTAKYIASLNPDIVIIQWSIAVQGLPLRSIVRTLKKRCSCEVIMDLHFVVQKERSYIDKMFTKMALSKADSYIVHANKTFEELQEVFPNQSFHTTTSGKRNEHKDAEGKPVIKLFHPIYDLYEPDPNFDIEAFKTEHGLKPYVFLFFGFIRKYKGLHNAIQAFHTLSKTRDDVSFLICGELFWETTNPKNWMNKVKKLLFVMAKKIFFSKQESESDYNPLSLIDDLDLQDNVVVFSEFIPNEDVHKYFQVSDCVVLYYSRATPSGIESLSYNFDLPILATRVGHFPETISEGENGYLADSNISSMASAMEKMIENPIPRVNIARTKENLSWEKYAHAILNG